MLEHINTPGFLPDEPGIFCLSDDMIMFIPTPSKLNIKAGEFFQATVSFWDGKEWKPFDNTDNNLKGRPPANSVGM